MILVTGMHRSGTTWVAKTLCQCKKTLYIGEPFNPNRFNSHYKSNSWYPHYTTLNEDQKRAIGLMKDFKWITSEFKHASSLRYSLGIIKNIINRPTPIVKDPIAFFLAPLFDELGYKVIITIKHPAAFVASLKRMNWAFDFNIIKDQEVIYNQLPYEIREQISKAIKRNTTLIEEGIIIWNIFHYYIKIYKDKYPQWSYVKIEDIIEKPIQQFEKLISHCNLTKTNKLKNYIIESTTSSNIVNVNTKEIHILKRNSKLSINQWQKELSPNEIDFIYQNTKKTSELYYSETSWEYAF